MQSLSSVEMKGRDLKTLWRLGLEINERPFKRPLLDLSKLSFSSFRKKGMSFYIIFRPFVLGMDSVRLECCSCGEAQEGTLNSCGTWRQSLLMSFTLYLLEATFFCSG